MKKNETVETNEKKESKVKAFFKRNGKKIAIFAGGAVCTVAGVVAIVLLGKGDDEEESNSEEKSDDFEDEEDENFKAFARDAKKIDEDIFTDLADKIERVVLDHGSSVIEKTYDLEDEQVNVQVFISPVKED